MADGRWAASLPEYSTEQRATTRRMSGERSLIGVSAPTGNACRVQNVQ